MTIGGAGAAAAAITTAGVAVVALMFVLAIALASARERLVESMQDGAPTVKRWGGRVLIVVGAWFVALGIFADFFGDLFPV